MNFKDITLSEREAIQKYTLPSDRQNCDLSWSNLCSWRFLYHTMYAITDDMLVIRFCMENETIYLMPIGPGSMEKALTAISDECREQHRPMKLYGVCEHHIPLIERWMPGRFRFQADRAFSDYIYLRESLSSLTGKSLQPKRNHINKFLKSYPDWEYSPIGPDNIQECLEMERLWCIENQCDQHEGLGQERQAVIYALHHFCELGLTGGLLRTNGRIVAFTFGTPINHQTFGVHVEKADHRTEGAYTMINREFVRHIPEQYTYINREEDLGIEGLRRAKLSYHPALILPKYQAEEIVRP